MTDEMASILAFALSSGRRVACGRRCGIVLLGFLRVLAVGEDYVACVFAICSRSRGSILLARLVSASGSVRSQLIAVIRLLLKQVVLSRNPPIAF
ncbi:hypothetical protein KCU90_g177, partial [Aureobasidium melanogenum]